MKKTELLSLLKSGDFTIAYNDNGSCSIYQGRYIDMDKLPAAPVAEFDCDTDGYLPKEVSMLVTALGGKALSI